MSKPINVVFASALMAASVFAGSQAFAASDGDYYVGATRNSTMDDDMNANASMPRKNLDLFSTQSIDKPDEGADPTSGEISPANGDYYQGAETDQ
jgi:hypothetical protein